jgi:hypothetical protein
VTLHIPSGAIWFLGGIGAVVGVWLLWSLAVGLAFIWQTGQPEREARRRRRREKRTRADG